MLISTVDLQSMRLRAGKMRQHIGLGLVDQRCDLRESGAQLIGDRAPLPTGISLAFLREDGADERGDHLALALGDVDQDVAHEVHPAALPGGLPSPPRP